MLIYSIPVLVFACSIYVFRLGRRGRQLNHHPICAACRFDLIGTYPKERICPECGAPLDNPGAVAIGARRPSRRLMTLGALGAAMALLVGAGVFLSRTSNVNWYQYMPTSWLIARAQSARPTTNSAILVELDTRYAAGSLGRDQIQKLIATTLSLQAKRGQSQWNIAWGDLFERMALAGDVSNEDYDQYLKQAVQLTATTRLTAHPDPNLPFSLSLAIDRGGSATQVFLEYELDTVEVDAQPVRRLGRSYGRSSMQGSGGGGSSSTQQWPLPLDVGSHEVTAVWRVRALESMDDSAAELAAWEVRSTSIIQIIPEDQALVQLASDPSLAEQFRADCQVEHVFARRLSNGKVSIDIQLRSEDRAVAVAMDAFLVNGHDEWRIGSFTFPREKSNYSTSVGGQIEGFAAEHARLELRPSIDAAEGTIDFEEVLGVTISYPVEIEWRE